MRRLAVLACLALASCVTGGGGSVVPPPTPVVTTPSPVCAAGQTYGCYHNPGTGWLYACPSYDLRTGGVIGVVNVPTEAACVKPVVLPPPVVGGETPVSEADCPPIDATARVRLPARPYAKKGAYTELMVLDSPSTCIAVHGSPVNPNSCHLEGWPRAQRCERYLIKKFGDGVHECPIWWARTPKNGVFRCLEDDRFGNSMSCDHFGSADGDKRDDPKTPLFEGEPQACGLLRDDRGKPASGFFTIVLGNGDYGASLPGATGPDTWTPYVEPD